MTINEAEFRKLAEPAAYMVTIEDDRVLGMYTEQRDAYSTAKFYGNATKIVPLYRAATPAQPIAPQLNEPTAELVERLTDYAGNPGYSHNDYADTMKQAAHCIGQLVYCVELYQRRYAESFARKEVAQPIAYVSAPTDEWDIVLTDADIDTIWQAMPGGPARWLKSFGYQQFAREIEDEVLSRRAAAPVSGPSDAAAEIAARFPELNMSNYGLDEVDALNAWGIEICEALDDAKPISAAPVSGQGASIGDDAGFVDLMNVYAKQIYSNLSTFAMDEARSELVRYIDSRARSEDSRAAPAAHSSAPSMDVVRKFVTDCAATSGGMINGNHLARYASKALAALAAPSPTVESLSDAILALKPKDKMQRPLYQAGGYDIGFNDCKLAAARLAAPTGASQ